MYDLKAPATSQMGFGEAVRRKGKRSSIIRRRLKIESLEQRTLLAADVVISEFMSANKYGTGLVDQDGEYSDWIELHNRGDTAANLNGWFLSDDSAEPQKWSFPRDLIIQPYSEAIVFASGKGMDATDTEFHTDFKLGLDEDFVGILSNANGTAMHSLSATSYPDVSYGLEFALVNGQNIATNNSGYFKFGGTFPSTPGTENPADSFDGRTTVEVSVHDANGNDVIDRGYFDETLTVTISHNNATSVYYTSDGSVPDTNDTQYTGPISVNDTTILRAIAVDGDTVAPHYFSSEIATNSLIYPASVVNFTHADAVANGYRDVSSIHPDFTYGIDAGDDATLTEDLQNLPIVSIATDKVGLFGDSDTTIEEGIYVPLANAVNGRGREWERDASVEFIPAAQSERGVEATQLNIGFRLAGALSRQKEKKDFDWNSAKTTARVR